MAARQRRDRADVSGSKGVPQGTADRSITVNNGLLGLVSREAVMLRFVILGLTAIVMGLTAPVG